MESSRNELRILGFILDGTPTVNEHVKGVVAKVRKRLWILRHLRKFGFDSEELVRVYASMIRAVIEFCYPVYHPLLTKVQSVTLERLQTQALKCIYGYGLSYAQLLEKSGLQRLDDRRTEGFVKFAKKTAAGIHSGWFPREKEEETSETIDRTSKNMQDATAYIIPQYLQ